MLRRDLVHGDPDARLRITTTRADAVEPGLFDDAVRAGALTALVAQTADDGHVLAEWLERLNDEWELEVAAGLRRLPLILQRAVREVDEAKARGRRREGLRECRSGRDHRVQQWKRDRCTGAFENRAP